MYTIELKIEVERESDGRYLAEIVNLPGVLAYGHNEKEAIKSACTLALRVVADRIEHGEPLPVDEEAPGPFEGSSTGFVFRRLAHA